jgi:hypothetical protein
MPRCQHVQKYSGTGGFQCRRQATRDGGTKCGFHSKAFMMRKEKNRQLREERTRQQERKDTVCAALTITAINIAMRADPDFAERWMAMEDMPPKEKKR